MPPRDGAVGVPELAAELRSMIAAHAAELARVADGGDVSTDTLDAAAGICRVAAGILAAAPLPPFWRGYLCAFADGVEVLVDAVGDADIDSGGTGRRNGAT